MRGGCAKFQAGSVRAVLHLQLLLSEPETCQSVCAITARPNTSPAFDATSQTFQQVKWGQFQGLCWRRDYSMIFVASAGRMNDGAEERGRMDVHSSGGLECCNVWATQTYSCTDCGCQHVCYWEWGLSVAGVGESRAWRSSLELVRSRGKALTPPASCVLGRLGEWLLTTAQHHGGKA